jgi:hypothetical protein
MSTITLFIGAHGSEPDTHPRRVGTRSSNHHHYPPGFTVNFLSFAGYANITTEAGILYKKEDDAEQLERMTKIRRLNSRLITKKTAEQLYGLGTDHVTLSYLVPSIFQGKEITTQAESISVMEDMKKEMLAVGILADLNFSKSSPPERTKNPQFEKCGGSVIIPAMIGAGPTHKNGPKLQEPQGIGQIIQFCQQMDYLY